jgi:cyclic beta-1,2-glucan synthetase
MTLDSVFSLAVGVILLVWSSRSVFIAAAPWLLLWFVSPGLGWLLTRRPRPRSRWERVTEGDQRFLRAVARRTWGYFTRFVNEETSWLPPTTTRSRTASARRCAQPDQHRDVALQHWPPTTRLPDARRGLETHSHHGDRRRPERHAGHLLNWYNLETLTPLEPRCLGRRQRQPAGALWTLRQGLEEVIRGPLLSEAALQLRDAVDVIAEEADGNHPRLPGSRAACWMRLTVCARKRALLRLPARSMSWRPGVLSETPTGTLRFHPERSEELPEPKSRAKREAEGSGSWPESEDDRQSGA